MSGKNKTWSRSEKLEILDCTKKIGVLPTSRKYGVSPSGIYKWITQLEKGGPELLERKPPARDLAIGRLEREVHALKLIIAEKELQLRIQEELIKKIR